MEFRQALLILLNLHYVSLKAEISYNLATTILGRIETKFRRIPVEADCDNNASFKAVTAISDASLSVDEHDFIPHNIQNEQIDDDWKDFAIHSGRIQRGTVLSIGHDGMTISEAKIYCNDHPNCVGFSYLVYSRNLTSPDSITFMSSINEFLDDGMGEWRTYISNDSSKTDYVNGTNIIDDDLPPPVCCEEREIPTIEEIEAVDSLPRISCNITREEFYEKYEKTRTPVMLVGCDKNWKAKERWTIDNLIPRFSNNSKWRAEIEDDPDDSREFVNWSEIKDRRATNRTFYIFDNVFQSREENKQLEEDYENPGPFQGADVYGHLKDFRDIDAWFRWFLVAPRGTGSFPHKDPQATDAWNALITGHKWWVLYPDAKIKSAKELKCDAYCSESMTEKAWYTSIGINALRNECSNEQFPQHILQKPGETIYVPFPLYHSVFNMDDTTCVTANFGSPANLWSVWHEIVIEGEEHWRRAYYQIFDSEQRKQLRNWNLWPVKNIDLKQYKSNNYVDYDDDEDQYEIVDDEYEVGDEEEESDDDIDDGDEDEDEDDEYEYVVKGDEDGPTDYIEEDDDEYEYIDVRDEDDDDEYEDVCVDEDDNEIDCDDDDYEF